MPQSQRVLQEFRRQKVSHLVGLPDNTSACLFAALEDSSDISLLTVTREGEAFAISAGLWMGGKKPVVVIQNTGFLECGDSFRGTVMRMRVPLVCLITYRGYGKMTNARLAPGSNPLDAEILSRPDLDSAALVTEPTMRAWGIPFEYFRRDDDLPTLTAAFERAERNSGPVAVLITEDFT